MVVNTRQLLQEYIRNRVTISNDQHQYIRHRRQIEILTGGNSHMYEEWIKKLADKMRM